MSRRRSGTVQIALRIPKEWVETAVRLAAKISRPGVPATATDAFRAAIAEGFKVLGKERT